LGFKRSSCIVFLDALLVIAAWLVAYWLRFNLTWIPNSYLLAAIHDLPLVMVAQMSTYLWFGLYRSDWRYASMHDLTSIVKAVCMGVGLIAITLFVTSRLQWIPRSIFPLYALLLIAFLGAPRFFYRICREGLHFKQGMGQRVLIVGAGKAGESLVRELRRDPHARYNPIAFVDDRKRRIGHNIHGVRIVGTCDAIPEMVKQHAIELIFIAIPTANSVKMRRIVDFCQQTSLPYRTLPSLQDLAGLNVSLDALRQVLIEDLLGRDSVQLDWQQLSNQVKNQIILITGGAGSIGSELSRQVARLQPKKLIIIDNSEFNLYTLQRQFSGVFEHLPCDYCLLDITDHNAVEALLKRETPDIVLHAAAYKHVPLLQQQVHAAVKNNLFATMQLAELAAQHEVKKFVFISTDKVVNPESVMGLSKRLAELYCHNMSQHTKTQFITVRFGNVLGSTGSVVPLFQQQIEQGGPITVTHPEATRYFMTIPEAAQLILQASVIGKNAEIYILDMGEPINIRYLAEQVIRLSGKQVGRDIDIIYTGLCPGEKLHEQLFDETELLSKTEHSKIMRAIVSRKMNLNNFSQKCHQLQRDYHQLSSAELLNKLQIFLNHCYQTTQDEEVLERV
jgi:FlaA1/EpsC-like NDP-sugar epimerase